MSHDHIGRRRLLQGAFLYGANRFTGGIPMAALCEAIVNGFVQRAFAETAGASVGPRNFITVSALGAPCRYAFDHWVAISNGETVAPNPMVSTQLTSQPTTQPGGSTANYNQAEYRTFASANGTLVPTFFNNSVNIGGAAQPLTDLLNQMLVIRGYGTGLDGHPANAALQLSPLAGAASLTGAVSDATSTPFAAVQYPSRGNFTQYSSAKGKGLLIISDANPLAKLMEAFAPTQARKAQDLKANVSTILDAHAARLKAIAGAGTPEAKIMAQNFSNANDLMKRGMKDIQDYWPGALARYKTTIKTAINTVNLPGISDSSIVNTANDGNQMRMYDRAITGGFPLATDFDARGSFGNMDVTYLAEGLALAEYMLRKGLGSSLELTLGNLNGIVTRIQKGDGVSNETVELPHDMHELGAAMMVLYTTALFRGFSAGVLELARQLKSVSTPSGTLWTDTVVQLHSDFGRIPRSNGSGSDHGFNQMVTSLYSGAIENGPFVIGNVEANSTDIGGYTGSQGRGAAIEGYALKGRPTPMMMGSTVISLMRMPENPYANSAPPLVALQNDRVVYTSFGKGKSV